MPDVNVTFTPTRADLMNASYLGLRSRPVVFWSALVFFVALPWLAAATSLFAGALGAPVAWLNIAILIAIPPLAVAFFACLPVWQARGALTLRGAHNYRFGDVDIHLEGPGFSNRVTWDVLTTCLVSRGGLLFNSGKVPLITVPARALQTDTQTRLLSLVSARGISLQRV
jgi:hypothetical protein